MDTENDKTCTEDKALDIVWNVLVELREENSKKLFLTILEKLHTFNYSGDLNEIRIEIFMLFVRLIGSCDEEDYDDVYQFLDKLFMSNALRKIIINSENITPSLFIANGDFGLVSLGKVSLPNAPPGIFAIKSEKIVDCGLDLRHEAKLMAGLDHKNVVKLVAFQRQPAKLVMEFVEGGDLKEAVKSHFITGPDILQAMCDVAAGMEYISGKKIIHRDLDSVNILVGANKVCRIGDFGLARYVGHNKNGEYTEKGTFKLAHLLPHETLKTGVFSTKSDVWTFGVVFWSLYELDKSSSKEEWKMMLNILLRSLEMIHSPKSSPGDVFKYLSEEILHVNPLRRPNFTDIHRKISEMLSSIKSNA